MPDWAQFNPWASADLIQPWYQAATLMWRIASEAPIVIALRTWQIASAGMAPSPRDQREISKMTAEKVEAMIESMLAIGSHVASMNLALASEWPRLAVDAGARRKFADQGSKMVTKGLVPFERRVTANAKRLRRAA